MLLRVKDGDQLTTIEESDLPCALSITPEGAPVFGGSPELPAAWIGFSNNRIFLQPGGDVVPVMLNGNKSTAPKWLSPGDTIGIGTAMLRLQQDAEGFLFVPEKIPVETAPEKTDEGKAQKSSSADRAPFFSRLPGSRLNRRVRDTILAFLAFLMLAVMFVLIAVPVKITVTPRPDTFSFDGFLSIPIMDRYLVFPGTYSISAKKEGYQDLQEPVTVKFSSKGTYTFTLRELPGLFNIMTQPVSGAEVSIDSIVVGTTPLQNIKLEKGSHRLHITAQGYKNHEQQIESPGLGTRQNITITLEPEKGAEQPQPPANTIEFTVTSEPAGARIMLNDDFRGTTPATLYVLPGLEYRVDLSMRGFLTTSRSVFIEPEEPQSITIMLEPEYGVVFVACKPADAVLKVDGKQMGTASRRLRLTTRTHRIEISKPGYRSFTTEITPVAGVAKNLSIQLQSLRHSDTGSVSGHSRTIEGQALRTIKLPEPVTFKIGASRREPGRRSNERLHKVTLTRSFSISEKEVTNAQFRKFRPGHNSGTIYGFDLNGDNLPVTGITWDDAARYLNWLSKKEGRPEAYIEKDGKMVPVMPMNTGYRLPTEAEWEFVARYAGVSTEPFKFPWGNSLNPPGRSGNYADSSAGGSLPVILANYTDDYAAAAPVGTFAANTAGLYDLGGNVSEWCHDYYDVYSGSTDAALQDPAGPDKGTYHAVRGSSWRHGSIVELRLSYRDYAKEGRNDLGFRIARYEKN